MPHQRHYLPADDRRRDLLEAAGRLFARGGFDAISMVAVAREAGVSRALVYQHFPDQDSLAVAYFDSRISAYFSAIDTTLDTTAGPEARGAGALRRLLELPTGDLRAVQAVVTSHGNAHVDAIRERLVSTTVERWQPYFAPTSDLRAARVAATVIVGAILELALAVHDGTIPVDRADRMLLAYIAATVAGVNGAAQPS